jgi:hypothetical protein
MLKRFIQKICVISLIISSALLASDYRIEDQPQVIEKVIQYEQTGILKQKPNGFLYLEVSSDYIADALQLIEVPGKLIPARHYTSKKGIGAHISVMYEDEQTLNEIWEIKELGQQYTFQILELRTVRIRKDNQVKKLWLIAVSSPELEALRMSYGLSPLLKSHDFHITVGTQVAEKTVLFEEEQDAA